ncbi:hypothetical protein GGC63_002312 [Paenibacillus sp. OAS669]|nr:hypothetical protein [Paenibacillus sp. OAS669]
MSNNNQKCLARGYDFSRQLGFARSPPVNRKFTAVR